MDSYLRGNNRQDIFPGNLLRKLAAAVQTCINIQEENFCPSKKAPALGQELSFHSLILQNQSQQLVEIAHSQYGLGFAVDTFFKACLSRAGATGMPQVTYQEEEAQDEVGRGQPLTGVQRSSQS